MVVFSRRLSVLSLLLRFAAVRLKPNGGEQIFVRDIFLGRREQRFNRTVETVIKFFRAQEPSNVF
jgi:hypothetical protein